MQNMRLLCGLILAVSFGSLSGGTGPNSQSAPLIHPTDPNGLPYWLDAVEILPENRTPLNPVVITLHGTWLDTCAPDSSAITLVDETDIYFTVNLPDQNACGDFPTPWQQTQIQEPLPPGHYRVFGILNHPLMLAPLIPELIAEFDVSPKATSSVFRFIPHASELRVTGGFAGIDETVPVEGRFQLTLDFVNNSAWFDHVNAKYGSGHIVQGGDLGMLYNMMNLVGEIDGPRQATFHGTTVPEEHEIFLQVRVTHTGALEVIGMQPATPVCCDFFQYDLNAAAVPVLPCHVDFHFLSHWLGMGDDPSADLDGSGYADLLDFYLITHHWLRPCPFDWPW
jgi:hypothetical protein